MTETERKPGDPYCSSCGYSLTGAVDSSKCPECGRPLVDVLVRHQVKLTYRGKRYRTTTKLMGLPLIDIALGPVENEAKGKAKGFIAIGDEAVGWLAIGGFARGFVAIGGFAMGVLSMGGMSIGLLGAVGGAAIGGFAAGGAAVGGVVSGGGAVGYVAQGGGAAGYFVRAGGGYGKHVIDQSGASSQEAIDMFNALDWFYGTGWPSTSTFMQPLGVTLMMVIFAGIALGLMAWSRGAKFGAGREIDHRMPQ